MIRIILVLAIFGGIVTVFNTMLSADSVVETLEHDADNQKIEYGLDDTSDSQIIDMDIEPISPLNEEELAYKSFIIAHFENSTNELERFNQALSNPSKPESVSLYSDAKTALATIIHEAIENSPVMPERFARRHNFYLDAMTYYRLMISSAPDAVTDLTDESFDEIYSHMEVGSDYISQAASEFEIGLGN